MDYYRVIPVAEGIFRITSPESVFMELLVGTEKALLIDTGYGFGPLKETIRQITDKPLVIVNTHGHVDHTCGNFRFEEPIYLSEADRQLMKQHNDPAFRARSVELARHTRDFATGEEYNGLPEQFDPDSYIRGGENEYLPLEEGMKFFLGGKTLRAVATPGHTRGSVSLLYEEENWLYAGDAANLFLWLFGPDATDKGTYLATLEKILSLAPERVYGAHAPEPFSLYDVQMFKRAALEADYETGFPFYTPILPDCEDVRVCVLDGKSLEDIGKPGFYSIVLDRERSQ